MIYCVFVFELCGTQFYAMSGAFSARGGWEGDIEIVYILTL